MLLLAGLVFSTHSGAWAADPCCCHHRVDGGRLLLPLYAERTINNAIMQHVALIGPGPGPEVSCPLARELGRERDASYGPSGGRASSSRTGTTNADDVILPSAWRSWRASPPSSIVGHGREVREGGLTTPSGVLPKAPNAPALPPEGRVHAGQGDRKKARQDYDANNPMGTVEYELAEYVQGDRIVFRRNRGYWGEAAGGET